MPQVNPVATIVLQAKSSFDGSMAAALVRTFIARGIASAGSFVLVILLGRLYGATGVGVYALAQSLVVGIAVFARWGMNNAVLRFVGRDLESPKAVYYLRYSCVRATSLGIIGAVAIILARSYLGRLFHSPALGPVLIGIAIAIPPFVLCYVLSGFMAAVRHPVMACLLQNGAISLAASLAIILLHYGAPGFGLTNIGIAYGVAAWVIAIWGLLIARMWIVRHCGRGTPMNSAERKEFKRSSSAFLATDIATFFIDQIGIFVAGYWLATSEVGLYKAAVQLAMLVGVILSVINLIIPTHFSHCFHHGDIARLRRLARQSSSYGLILAGIPILACLFAPEFLLSIVGHDFLGAALILQVLAVGQIFNLGCGSVGHLLNMTGHEEISRNIAWVSNAIGFAVLSVGAPLAGVLGIASGVSLAMALRKLLGVYYVWRRLGIWVLPMPNVLRLFGVHGTQLPANSHTATKAT